MPLDGGDVEISLQIGEAFEGLFQPYRHKALHGGRGSAKSHSAGEALTIRASQAETRIVCCRQFAKATEHSTHQLIADKIKQHNMGAYWDVQNEVIRGHLGSEFIFHGLERNPESIKSLEGADVALVEEASEINQRSVDILIPTVRKPGSELWWIWNPFSPDDPVDRLFRGGNPPPRSWIKEVSYLDNPYFFQTELPDEMEADRLRDFDKYEHVWLGKYKRLSEAAVYKHWRVGRIDTTGMHPLLGLDFGFSVDPAAFVKAYYVEATARAHLQVITSGAPFLATPTPRPLLYIAAEAYGAGIETDQMPTWLKQVPGAEHYPITADGSRPEMISYLQRHGFPMMTAAVKGPGSVEDGIDWVKGVDILIDPECVATKHEIENYAYKVEPKTKKVLPILAGKFDNIPDAIRYAVETLRRTGSSSGNFGFTSLSFGKRR